MTRDEVFELVRNHLAEELEIDPARITYEADFREDLEADSLHLVILIMELEDSYGVKISDVEARDLTTVGKAVDFVLSRLATTA